MKNFNSCSGPWVGQSIQEGLRITEKIELWISNGVFHGSGVDADGDFTLRGSFDPGTGIVSMVRTYTRAPKFPSQVGYPFDYLGRWDGELVHGRWMMSTEFGVGGPFEMWPEGEEEIQERAIQLDEMVAR